MFESHIQQVGHKLQICDMTTGHSVKNIAFVDDADRAKDMANKLNNYNSLVIALDQLLTAAIRVEGFVESCTAAVHTAGVTLLIAKGK